MKSKKNKMIVYQARTGAIELREDFKNESVWATLDQIASVFGRDKSVISRHLKNIFKEGELRRDSVVAKIATTAADGKTYQMDFYNLDAILSVGYRVNSKTATHFRQWATKTLREHITKGYSINRKRIMSNYEAFMKAVGDIQALLPAHTAFDPKQALELVKEFASTWVSLDAYDKELLAPIGTTKKAVRLTGEELTDAIADFRAALFSKQEVSDIFAQERQPGSIVGIVGNVMQSFSGNEVYQGVEEKAAHLLYFMVKNHPFVDGNKRSGAYAFVWFLKKAGILARTKITAPALTALTLFVAESEAKNKELVIRLILQLLKK
jgi:prophage maintenance system killer protein/predicted transcriptional regulator